MTQDLLEKTKKQILDLMQNQFFKEADEIIKQAIKVFGEENFQELEIVSAIGLQRYEEIESKAEKLCMEKKHPANYSNLSIVKRSLKKLDEALEYAKKAIELNDKNPNYYGNLSGIYWDLCDYQKAHETIDLAILNSLNPESLVVNKAGYYFEQRLMKESIQAYKKAIELNPKNPAYYVEIFYCLATMGRLSDAWPFYEYRYDAMPTVAMIPKKFKLPVMPKAENYDDVIAIVFEQGLGDNIMYLRFLNEFMSKWQKSYILTKENNLKGIIKAQNWPASEEVLPNTKYLVGIMSLPYHLDTNQIPPPCALGIHRPKVSSKKRIGIVWAGSAYHPMDHTRSTYLSDFEKFYTDDCFEISHFVADTRKRKKFGKSEVIDYAAGIDEINIIDYGKQCKTVEDTIKLLDEIDILVTVDTAIAHIAGSLGVQTHILVSHLNDWRWGLEGDKSIWYPSVTIHRKKQYETYKEIIERVYKKIRDE